MTKPRVLRLALNLVAALIVPIAVELLFLFVRIPLSLTVVHLLYSPYVFYGAIIACGFVFLVYEFRVWAILIGLLYFPLMFYALIYISLGVSVRWLGEGP